MCVDQDFVYSCYALVPQIALFVVGVCSAIIKGELYILEDSNNILVPAFRDEQCTDDIAVVLLNVRPLKSDAQHAPVPVSPSAPTPKLFTCIDHRSCTQKSNVSSKSVWCECDPGRNLLKQLFLFPSPPRPDTITLGFSLYLSYYRRRSRKLYRCLKYSFPSLLLITNSSMTNQPLPMVLQGIFLLLTRAPMLRHHSLDIGPSSR